MATWSVLTRALPGDTGTASAERVAFVREKFSWATLFLAPFVLLRYRLWLAFGAYVAVSLLVGGVIAATSLPEEIGTVVMGGINLLLAFELPALRVRKLAALGYAEEGVVVAEDREEAEQRFFTHWAARQPEPPVRAVARPTHPAGAMPAAAGVIGSFPGAGSR